MFRRKIGLLAVSLLIVFGIFLTVGFASDVPRVKTATLVSEYSKNPIAWNAKYKDKTVIVTGKIVNISFQDVTNNYVITLDNNVSCFFIKDKEQSLVDLKKGQDLTVIGIVSFLTVGKKTSFSVHDCDIYDSSFSSPDFFIKASDLHKEFAENEVAANLKYKNKSILVTGKINHISNSQVPLIYLKGYGLQLIATSGIRCDFSASDKEAIALLKKGQEVTIFGKFVSGDTGQIILSNCKLQ